MTRYGKDFNTVTRARNPTFYAPLHWKNPRAIFTCSWGDFFHKDADPWREEAWEIMKSTPQHTYMILTKRPGRMLWWGRTHEWSSHVWAGTSVESKKYLPRLELLRWMSADLGPTLTTFVSCEPLLEPLDISEYLSCDYHGEGRCWETLDWVIAGGESGPNTRSMELDWARAIRDDCVKVGVPFFLKQLGGWPDKRGGDKAMLDGRLWRGMPGGESRCG